LRTVQANSIAFQSSITFYHPSALTKIWKADERAEFLIGADLSGSSLAPMFLDTRADCRYRRCMAHSYLIFDFGKNEEAAQQARHKVESWKQGFRLGNKILIKFERAEAEDESDAASKHDAAEGKRGGKKKSSAKGAKANAEDKDEDIANVRVLVRLDFSDHEKLSLQRWLDRIPTEEPFKSVEGTIIRQGDPEFVKTAELFETLG
jgi:hypothetical protein